MSVGVQLDDVFIVLTYKNTHDVLDLIKSIKSNLSNFRIIIVNSFFDEETNSEFEHISEENDCDFLSIENKGYGYGNNCGIKYALERYEFRRAVVSNPDIILKEYDIKTLGNIEDGIIGGDITTVKGKRQNPLRVYDNDFTTNSAYEYYVNGRFLRFVFGVAFAKFQRTMFLLRYKNTSRKKVYALHGSFMIFPIQVLKEIGPVFDEHLFLFGEELDLADRFMKSGISMYYSGKVKVMHKEDGSMKVSNVNIKKQMAISCEYIYKKHKVKQS